MGIYAGRNGADYQVGVWRCDESIEELLRAVPLPQSVIDESQSFKAPHRRAEWLFVRALFREMTGRYIPITYEESGKPRVEGGFISISHTKGYVAVAYSAVREVAVDIEQYGERVVKVAPRFMNPAERPSEYNGSTTWSLLLHWSAKETAYKMVGLSAVDFTNSIIIRPFEVTPSGTLFADTKIGEDRWNCLPIDYLIDRDFVLTFSVGM
jgi:phosphopantetheinyl transferase